MTKRRRMLQAYALGLCRARAVMQGDLEATRDFLDRELASLRAEISKLRARKGGGIRIS